MSSHQLTFPNSVDTIQGHLLQRILSKQPNLALLDSPYSGCRGQQVGWLMSEEWDQGMPDDTKTAFRAAAAEATEKWRHALAEAGRKVRSDQLRWSVINMRLTQSCRIRS